MKVLRTPGSQFADLPDYNFTRNYTSVTDVDGTVLRMHSVDVGHFSPEEVPEQLAALLLEFIGATQGRPQMALAENGASAHQQSLERA